MGKGTPETWDDSRGMQEMVDALGALVSLHFKVARLEVQQQLKGFRQPVLVGLLLLPWLVTGSVFLSISVALLLARWLPLWGAVAMVGTMLILFPTMVAGFWFRRWVRAGRQLSRTEQPNA